MPTDIAAPLAAAPVRSLDLDPADGVVARTGWSPGRGGAGREGSSAPTAGPVGAGVRTHEPSPALSTAVAVLSVGRETLRGGERLARRLYYGLRALNYDVGAARGPLAAQECGLAGIRTRGLFLAKEAICR